MGKDASNVIDFTARRGGIVPRALREVEAYWELLRGSRIVPDRSQIDPRGFPGALPYSFLLERIAPGLARIRLTGRHLSDLMGIDLQGLPLTSLFQPEARPGIIEITSAVFEEPAVARLRLASGGGVGRQPIEAHLILLPLRDDLGDVTRAIGCLVAEGPIGRTPRRFTLTDTQCQTLIGYGRHPASGFGQSPAHGKTESGIVIALPPRRD